MSFKNLLGSVSPLYGAMSGEGAMGKLLNPSEAKRIAGSIPLQIPTAKLTIVGLLAKIARKELETGQAKDEKVAKKSGAARLFNLDGKGAGEREATIALAD